MIKRINYIAICLILLPLVGCIRVNPKTLDFGSDETTKTFTLTVIGNVEWTINYSESWLSVAPDNGQDTDTITATVDRTGLDDGSYEARLSISTNPNIPCPDVIVTMTVGDVTTSTTTTSPSSTTTSSGCDPNPVIPNPTNYQTEYEWDKWGNCLGGTVSVEVVNEGCAGEVLVDLNWTWGVDCQIIHMDKDEKRMIGLWDRLLCPGRCKLGCSFTFSTRSALSSDFPKCKKSPRAKITSPLDDSVYRGGKSVTFSGEAKYTYNGELAGNSLIWTSDVDGQIGTGNTFTIDNLSTTGTHLITLTATDSLGDESTDSISIFVDIADRMVWEYEAGGRIAASPTISDGYVYFGSDDHKVYCLDAKNGKRVWEYDTGGIVRSSPAVSGGYVYVVSTDCDAYQFISCSDGYVYCLDAKEGNLEWTSDGRRHPLDGGIYISSIPSPSVAISEGYLYVSRTCLDIETGDTVWKKTMSDKSNPAVLDGYVYVGTSRVDAKDGKVNQEYDETITYFFGGPSPAVSGGYVYYAYSGMRGNFYCLDAESGNIIWDNEYNSNYPPAISDGYVYVCRASTRGDVLRMDAITGEKDDIFFRGGGSSPAVSDGYVYVGGRNVSCFDFNTNTVPWIFNDGENNSYSSPVVSDGYVYVGVASKIYCLKAAEGDTGSWPMFKYNLARTGAR